MVSHNIELGNRLREAHRKWAIGAGKKARSIRLPEPSNLAFFVKGDHVSITMSQAAVAANMQTNSATFEGWCLAVKLWLPEIKSISLCWSPPAASAQGGLDRHYARFLYRVQRFDQMFSWFTISSAEHLDACQVRAGADLYLNVAGPTIPEATKPSREACLEAELVGNSAHAMMAEFNLARLDRQFPVGLYSGGRPTKASAIFTGGASAIDMIGTDDETFTLFELKAGKNIMVGALGEMLFYARVVQDAAGPKSKPRFLFAEAAPGRATVGPSDVQAAKRIRAVLIAEEFHPLLEHPDLIATLNAATAETDAEDAVPLRFEARRISGVEEKSIRFHAYPAIVQ